MVIGFAPFFIAVNDIIAIIALILSNVVGLILLH